MEFQLTSLIKVLKLIIWKYCRILKYQVWDSIFKQEWQILILFFLVHWLVSILLKKFALAIAKDNLLNASFFSNVLIVMILSNFCYSFTIWLCNVSCWFSTGTLFWVIKQFGRNETRCIQLYTPFQTTSCGKDWGHWSMLWHIGHIDTGMQSKVVNPSKFSGWTV